MEDQGTPAAPLPEAPEVDVVGEARWPMAGAVLAAMVLTLLLPDDLRLGPSWALPLLEGVLLVTIRRVTCCRREPSSGPRTILPSPSSTGSWDGGGSAARAHDPRGHPDLAFPQQLNPHISPPGWRPRFIDYLYLGFTNATAFSPTDVMPLAPWAKIAMTVAFGHLAGAAGPRRRTRSERLQLIAAYHVRPKSSVAW